jgi:uncharacterized membrane protein
MPDRLTTSLLIAAILGAGMIAGTFLAFSTFVMKALALQPHPGGLLAMRAINITVVNPLFMGVLFGTAALSLWLGYAGFRTGNWWVLAGAVFYVVGVIGVTMAFNVPLNDGLAALAPSPASEVAWKDYVSTWTMWNSIRMAGAAVSSACFAVALMAKG